MKDIKQVRVNIWFVKYRPNSSKAYIHVYIYFKCRKRVSSTLCDASADRLHQWCMLSPCSGVSPAGFSCWCTSSSPALDAAQGQEFCRSWLAVPGWQPHLLAVCLLQIWLWNDWSRRNTNICQWHRHTCQERNAHQEFYASNLERSHRHISV